MKKSISFFTVLFCICLLQSCTTEECVTCSKENEENVTYCSDGTIIGDSALQANIDQAVMAGYSCN